MEKVLSTAAMLLASMIAWTVWILYLHPLAKVPGSKLAALSPLLQLYYDVYHQNGYYNKISHWHKVYGKSCPNSRRGSD
jgi:hypothetical protein